ncbi:MAG: Ppx/GppA family phosphatase [Clostridia bacterium]|nr:Ppx/GppA family phosphatase [Clostridia bacterium]
MLRAAIDLGTNSVRLLVGTVEKKRVAVKYTGLQTCRLGQGLQPGGEINPQAVERTLQALSGYHRLVQDLEVKQVNIVATSALREAKNADGFCRQVERLFGWSIKIISGEEEAFLSYLGATSAVKLLPGLIPVVLDIGGGSTELVFSAQGRLEAASYPVGAVRCTENTLSDEEIRSLLEPGLQKIVEAGPVQLIGAGGTVTSLAAVAQGLTVYDPEAVQGFLLPKEEIHLLREKLAAMSPAERMQLPGLHPGRADVIVAGAAILQVIVDGLDCEKIMVSDADLLHGILLHYPAL